jgi:hypothetical protein
MAMSADKEQSNAQVDVHDQFSVIVHNAELKQDITVTDNSSFKSVSVKKKTVSSSTDTVCIAYKLRPRTKSRELSRPFSSSHDSRNTHTLSCRPVQYLNNSEVAGVKQKLASLNDNISIQLSSVAAETCRVTPSGRSSKLHSECDMNAHACNLAPVEHFDNSGVVGVKEEILDCEEGHHFEGPKEEMLSVSNISCVSYVFQARNDDTSNSEVVDSGHREDTKISDVSETCKTYNVDSVVKQPFMYKTIASRSCGLRSGIQYHEVRDGYIEGNSDSDKNNKNSKHCKKISGYYLRPRNTKTDKFTSGRQKTCSSKYSATGHNVQTKPALIKDGGGGEFGNQNSVSTVGMSCGAYNLRPIGVPVRQSTMTHGSCTQVKHEIQVSSTDVSSEAYYLRPRNRQGRFSKPLSLQHREDTIMCSSGVGYSHKLINAEDIKQETPSYDVDTVSLSCAVCSRTHCPKMDKMYVNLEVKGEIDNDENDALECSRGRSVYNFQDHCRNYLHHHSEANVSRNNCTKPKVVTADDTAPRLPTAFFHACGQRLIIENTADVGSSMHMVTDYTSSDRNIPYVLQPRIVKDILDQDLTFRQEIKEEGIQTKTVEIPKKLLSSDSEAIPVDSFKNMNTGLHEQDSDGNKGCCPCNTNNSVGITDMQNLSTDVGSSVHTVTDATSSDRNIPYYLRSHSIVKEVLDQDLPFRKEIKKEGIHTKTVEIPKTLLSYNNEAIQLDSFKNVDTRLCEQDDDGNKGYGPCSIDGSVGVTGVQNLSESVGSSMHMVTYATSSDRNIR